MNLLFLNRFHSFVRFKKLVKEYRSKKTRKVVIEVHAADHCNLNCRGCSHYSPIAKPSFCDLNQMKSNYEKLSRFENAIRIINILGGEPLLNPEICGLMKLTRKYFPNTNIRLLTNGVLLLSGKIPPDFWECCRENNIDIRMTQYPINMDYNKVEDICKINNVSFSIASTKQETLNRWNKIELAYTHFPYLKYRFFFFKKTKCPRHCMQLKGDRLYPCTITAHVNHLNDFFGARFKIRKGDYIEVDKIKSEKDIHKLLYTTHPFCMYHKRTVSNTWKTSEKRIEEWTKSK